jgi:multidrug transporter EmrE-like cation transporter
MGNVTLVPPTSPNVTLKGLSLSLLHFTFAVSSEGYAVRLNGSSIDFDSQTSQTSSGVNLAQVIVPGSLAYEFRFNDNYTLLTNAPVSLRAVYEAASVNSLPSGAFQGQGALDLIRVQDYVRAALPSIAGLPSSSDLNYATSKLIYRVSYPIWKGIGIRHDPTYVGYFVPTLSTPLPPVCCSVIVIYSVIALAVVAGITAFLVIRRTRKTRTRSHDSATLPLS